MRNASLAALVLLVGCGDASSVDSFTLPVSGSSGPSCETGKQLVCHLPPGNPANEHEICVGAPAVKAHLAHGDRQGACAADPCATLPDGTMFCSDVTTFVRCDHGVSVPFQCAPGTECKPFQGSILCDWPTCTPPSCADHPGFCGTLANPCGASISCAGNCGPGEVCSSARGTCGPGSCALYGQACTTDADCCSAVPAVPCTSVTGNPCAGSPGCTCHYRIQ